MWKYVVKRLAAVIPVFLCVTIFMFVLSYLSAGDAARILAEQSYHHPTVDQIELIRHENGLDQPIYVQYGRWLNQVLHGDFGCSYQTGKSALQEFGQHCGITLKLALLAFAMLLLIGFPLGILSAVYENSLLDKVIQALSFFSVSMPSFWIALILLYLFSVHWHMVSVLNAGPGIMVLAAFSLDVGYFGIVIRLIRSSLQTALKQDYIRAAYARGLSPALVVIKHGMKNSLLPVTTRMVGICISLFSGSAIIETIFSVRGIGYLALEAAKSKDTPVLQCFILIVSAVVLGINLLVDILYSMIDKRIQLS